MLSHSELLELDRSLRGSRVLSVYIDGNAPDPAKRAVWRRRLENSITDLRRSLESAPHAEREAFEQCVRLLWQRLATIRGAIRAPGFVAFIAEDGVRYADVLPSPTPTLVAWETGARVAPYVRALKQQRPVIIAMVDHRRARLYRYRFGALEELETLRARAHVGPMERMEGRPSSLFHPGTRGATGADEADRVLRSGHERMLSELAGRLVALAGEDGWIVIGGTPQPAKAAARALPAQIAPRSQVMPSLELRSTRAEIARAAARGASLLRGARDREQVAELIDRAAAGGAGTAGVEPTLDALHAGAVEALFFSQRFLEQHAAEAEAAIREAFDQDASVEEVTGTAATRLDAEAGGMAARLRFAYHREPAAAESRRAVERTAPEAARPAASGRSARSRTRAQRGGGPR